jgi:hypothetical protein
VARLRRCHSWERERSRHDYANHEKSFHSIHPSSAGRLGPSILPRGIAESNRRPSRTLRGVSRRAAVAHAATTTRVRGSRHAPEATCAIGHKPSAKLPASAWCPRTADHRPRSPSRGGFRPDSNPLPGDRSIKLRPIAAKPRASDPLLTDRARASTSDASGGGSATTARSRVPSTTGPASVIESGSCARLRDVCVHTCGWEVANPRPAEAFLLTAADAEYGCPSSSGSPSRRARMRGGWVSAALRGQGWRR